MLHGKNLIDGVWAESKEKLTSHDLDGVEFSQASKAQIDEACKVARRDFRSYSGTSREARLETLGMVKIYV